MRLMKRVAITPLSALVLAMALPACSDDDSPTTPTREAVVGSYAATRLTATLAGIPVNLLALGSSLTATFASDGTLTGRLVLRSVAGAFADHDDALNGTWRIETSVVDVDVATPTRAVDDIQLRLVGNTLVGDETLEGRRVQVVLTKR